MKTTVINVLPHPPAYKSYHGESRFKVSWDIPGGRWVGIEGNDWPDLIGREVLKISRDFDYQVWQPDPRADKVYAHRFAGGLEHLLFPAREAKTAYGLKLKREIGSDAMLEKLKESLPSNPLLHLNGLSYSINREICRQFPRLPKIIQFHSTISTPYLEMTRWRKNILANPTYLKFHAGLKKNRRLYFVHNNSKKVDSLKKYSPLGVSRIFMGCDFHYWCPQDRDEAKKAQGFDPRAKVFLLASRFNSLKQIDRVIDIFSVLDRRGGPDFKLIIAGHGEKEYEEFLKGLAPALIQKGRLLFPGYLDDEKMRALYRAADLFISASTSEGGPTSAVKAIACRTPVMCTRVGGVDDWLDEQRAGLLVDKADYRAWLQAFSGILEGKLTVAPADRERARNFFHWANIAEKWIDIYGLMSDNSAAACND